MNSITEMRKNFLVFSIALISVCAIIILFLIVGAGRNFSGGKVITSAMIIWVGAFIVFLCALHYQYPKRQWLAIIGSVCAGLFVLMVLYETWKPRDLNHFGGGGFWGQTKFVMLLYVFSLSFAQMALVMLIKPISEAVSGLKKFTVGSIFATMALAFYALYLMDRPGEGILKLVMIVGILDMFGTTVTPMVYKLHKKENMIDESVVPVPEIPNSDSAIQSPPEENS